MRRNRFDKGARSAAGHAIVSACADLDAPAAFPFTGPLSRAAPAPPMTTDKPETPPTPKPEDKTKSVQFGRTPTPPGSRLKKGR